MGLLRETDITFSFQSAGALAAEEIWVCRKGKALVTLEAGTDNDRGIPLSEGMSVRIPAGKTPRYRKLVDDTWIAREVTG